MKKYFVIYSLFIFCLIYLFNIPHIYAANKTINIGLKQDLYVESGYPNTITYNQRNLFLGYDTAYNKHITRIYFKPDYSILKTAHITPEQIISVKTNFHIYKTSNAEIKVRAYKVNTPWEQEDVTYNSQPNSSYYTYKTLQPSVNILQVTLTNAFKQDYANFLDNNPVQGFMLRLTNEQKPAIRIWSTECLQATGEHCANESYKPSIKIEYKDNTVPELGDIIGPQDNYKTNSNDIAFVFKRATDADDDPLFYRIAIASDPEFTHVIKTSNWIDEATLFPDNASSALGNIIMHLTDNIWYWRLEVKDSYNNKAVSPGRQLVIDTTPPVIPQIEPEPPYTKGTDNTIYLSVSNPEQGEMFQYEASQFRDFSNVMTSPWIQDLQYTFQGLKDTKYYYRVRAIDELGNISNWSSIISSTQDNSKPAIVYFKASKKVLGPNDKNITLKARFYDPTLYKIRLAIYDHSGKLLLSKTAEDSSYIGYSFNVTKLQGGTYFAYAQAIDRFSHQSNSNPIKIIIDKRSPILQINGIFTKKKYINTGKLEANISCLDSQLPINTTIYLNNTKLKQLTQNKFSYLFYLKDKNYHIKISCKDLAGNTTQKDYYFTIDTKAPLAPQFKYSINKDRTQATISTKCSIGETLHFYFNKKYHTIQCKHSIAKYTIKGLGPGNTYSVIGYLQDQAGNKGPSNSLTFAFPKPTQQHTIKPVNMNCFVTYDATKFSYITKYCKYEKPPTYNIKGYYSNNSYIYNVFVNIPQSVNLLFKEINCKPRSLWDIRTWFSCIPVTRTVYSTHAYLGFTGFIDNKPVKTLSTSKNQVKFIIRSQNALKTKQLVLKSLLLKSFIPCSSTPGVLFLKIRNPLVLKQTINFPYVRKPISVTKPLSWMFNKPYRITQWFGHTCYEPWHTGIDIGVYKKKVLASADGTIYSFGYHKGNHWLSGGIWVSIKHPFGLYTYYWHLDPATFKIKLYRGMTVRTGQLIAISGNTGWYHTIHNPYHLHFEVRAGKYARHYLDPTKYLNINWKKFPVCIDTCCTSGNDPRRR